MRTISYLCKILTFSAVFSSTAFAVDPVSLYGFGKSGLELGADGYKSVVKSTGTEIYEKNKTGTYPYYKIVYKKKDKKPESVSRIYSDSKGQSLQYTKLDQNGKVLGQVQCKVLRTALVTSCDGQTANTCKELIGKVESEGFDVDLKKIKECADISSRINYSRDGVDQLMDESSKELAYANGGAIPPVMRSTPSSLQTLLKDYSACKKIESELSDQLDPNQSSATKSAAEAKKGRH